jgi:RNA polymerase sigma-70 factor (ECF subfamily)
VTVYVARFVTAAPPDDASAIDSREAPEVRALVEAARAGDREAFGALVSRDQGAAIRAAMAALGSREDAEDVAQDAFVTAWRKLGGFRGDAAFRTWLLTIVWRKALDRRRVLRRHWQQHGAPDRGPGPALDQLVGTAADPERRAVAADMVERTRREIRRLSPRLRDTLLLAASGHYTYEEIAGMLGVPVGTVKWRVSEARRLVTARLRDAGGPR